MSFSFSHLALPALLPTDWGQCYCCGAEWHERDAHMMYDDGCVLCRPDAEELRIASRDYRRECDESAAWDKGIDDWKDAELKRGGK